MAREILGVFEIFLGIFEKTKEKKDRAVPHTHIHIHICCGVNKWATFGPF